MPIEKSIQIRPKKEKRLSKLLYRQYQKHLTYYNTTRLHNLKNQLAGVDIVFIHKLK